MVPQVGRSRVIDHAAVGELISTKGDTLLAAAQKGLRYAAAGG
jgi:hypothetical protein